MNHALQRYQLARMLENSGTDPDAVDLEALVDEELNLHENIENVENEIGRPVITGEEPGTEELEGMQRENDQKLLDSEEYKELYMEQKWLKIVEVPGVVLLRGRRRYGKTALAMYLLWLFHEKRELTPCVVNFPKEKRSLLPDFIKCIYDLDDIPPDSIVYFDEVSMEYYADKYHTSVKELLDKMINISGQKNQLIIFVSHHSAKILKSIVREVDAQLFKLPSKMHAKMERGEIKIFTKQALEAFENLGKQKEELKEYTYIITEDFDGFVKNPLPPFWNEKISRAWKDTKVNVKKDKKRKQAEEEDSSKLLLFFNGEVSEFSRVIAAEVSEGQYGFDHIAEFDIVEGSEGYICSQGGKSFFGLIELVEKLREKGIECIVDTRVEITKIK